MAIRRERMLAQAEHRRNKVPLLMAKFIKEQSFRFIPHEEVKDKSGKVIKVTSAVECRFRMKGMADPIICRERMESNEKITVEEEIDQVLSAAMKKCLINVKVAYLAFLKEKEEAKKKSVPQPVAEEEAASTEQEVADA